MHKTETMRLITGEDNLRLVASLESERQAAASRIDQLTQQIAEQQREFADTARRIRNALSKALGQHEECYVDLTYFEATGLAFLIPRSTTQANTPFMAGSGVLH